VFNARREPVAAVGMSVPSIRFARAQARALADQLLACAHDASLMLGYQPLDEATTPRIPATTRRQR
jgi:IclR family KDG regulon transcriptional repressor